MWQEWWGCSPQSKLAAPAPEQVEVGRKQVGRIPAAEDKLAVE